MSNQRRDLDAALRRRGEDIILRRQIAAGSNITNIDVTCRARVDTVSAEEIAGTIAVSDLKVILSPTQIMAAQWPGGVPQYPVTNASDPRVPRITDFVIARGKQRQVKMVDPKFTPDWCRINMVVAG
ncbi:hypothetical protein LB523_12045 [Mesorhizobium sp. ESP-6-4]|uniref:hypothetical protein n=1 Tax=Mesorhizobium sp. ESP-6-4 TaxID=2876624 RepID=UPI001CCB0345|nr:hypothetical protein [Mesorhizobium sp. ESP-6-4]MBZ9659777.1 hypothetical protein [Mesorhizobium sp. ESP-6-4]